MLRKILLIVSIVVSVCFISKSALSKDFVINFSGGAAGEAVEKFFIKPFEEAKGVKVFFEPGDHFAKVRTMVKSGNVEWDLAGAVSLYEILLGEEEGILEPLDYNIIDTTDLIKGGIHPYGIAKAFYSTVLAYNTNTYPKGKHPKSWKDFWDVKKFPGRRALRRNPFNNLEWALLADGVTPEKLYPLDIDRAFRSLDKIKPYINVWWTAGAQPAQLLTDGEVDMASAWNGRIYNVKKQGAKVEIEWNEGMLQFSAWIVPKGAENKKLAMEFINFTHQPKLEAAYAEYVGYPGVNKKTYQMVKPELAPNLPTYPENLKKQIVVDYKWWYKNKKEVQERWDEWIMKK
jgi:putative spermidine/putrescine transport system substrate-binding protein